MLKISRYIILSSILLCGILSAGAQERKTETKKIEQKKDSVHIPLWQGFMLEFDIAPLVETALSNNSTYSTQGNIQFNLAQKYFPVIEFGVSGANKISNNDVTFKTNGLFGKVGVDFSLLKEKPGSKIMNNHFFGGVRLGMTNFKYSINNLTITDDYWGGSEQISLAPQSETKLWFEIVAGIRVEVYKRIYLGWNVRNKHLINQDKPGTISPWYIPGYGKNTSSLWGFSYIIGYRF